MYQAPQWMCAVGKQEFLIKFYENGYSIHLHPYLIHHILNRIVHGDEVHEIHLKRYDIV